MHTVLLMWYLLSTSLMLIAILGVFSQSTTNAPPRTRPNCDGITPAPDYRAHCNATNSFTLPNGRFVDEYDRFCVCAETVLEIERIFCNGGADISTVSCNSDGTFNCIMTNGLTGWPQCFVGGGLFPGGAQPNCTHGFCEPACLRYSKNLQRYQNIRSCTCTTAQNQQFNSTLSANYNYIPQCNADGSWKKQQTGYGGRWCVDTSGSQNGVISFETAYPPVC